jgi:hypothetical protein
MPSIAARRLLPRLAALLGAGCAVAALAEEPPIVVKKRTRAGQEVLVRGFAEFDASCNLKHVQTIAVSSAPAGGKVETRPGNVVIGPNWVGGGHCEGTTLRGRASPAPTASRSTSATRSAGRFAPTSRCRFARRGAAARVTGRAGAPPAPS